MGMSGAPAPAIYTSLFSRSFSPIRQTRRSSTRDTKWSTPFSSTTSARGRVGWMFFTRFRPVVRSQIAAATRIAASSERGVAVKVGLRALEPPLRSVRKRSGTSAARRPPRRPGTARSPRSPRRRRARAALEHVDALEQENVRARARASTVLDDVVAQVGVERRPDLRDAALESATKRSSARRSYDSGKPLRARISRSIERRVRHQEPVRGHQFDAPVGAQDWPAAGTTSRAPLVPANPCGTARTAACRSRTEAVRCSRRCCREAAGRRSTTSTLLPAPAQPVGEHRA